MRKEVYDKLLMEGIEKIKSNPKSVKLAEQKIEAFEKVLNETNGENLNKYYRNMDDFFGANMNDITLIDPRYLLANESHTCVGDDCNHKTVMEVKEEDIVGEIEGVNEVPEDAEIVNIMEIKE